MQPKDQRKLKIRLKKIILEKKGNTKDLLPIKKSQKKSKYGRSSVIEYKSLKKLGKE